MSQLKARTFFGELDDPFLLIKKIFIDYGYSKPVNYYNRLGFILHTCTLILENYFVVKNFSLDYFTKYGCVVILMHYFLISQFLTILNEKLFKELIGERGSLFWKSDSSSPRVKNQIVKHSVKFNRKFCFVLFWFVALGIIVSPVWGDLSETHLFPQVYKTYFGIWSPVFYYFYVSTLPLVAYTAIRIPAIALYLILQLDLQKILLCEQISLIPSSDQVRIYKKMRLCISQDRELKKWIAKIRLSLKRNMSLYICIAFLCLITVMFFILNNLTTTTDNVTKMGFFVAGMCGSLILYTFSEAGQLLFDYTEDVSNTLIQCPWYCWNTKNRKLYLMLMQNCQKPLKINWGSVTLNYCFGGSVIKTCCSDASIFFKLRNDK
ncbi:odorant receptor 184 [Tribolium castaneum]|uniref:Odorant receptor n=1 Tax=Tribolium castaneum TaxID=7070 RepID=D6WEP2_TRICA|nr:odorant receptor 184 [Tribolium castaneum]